MAAARANGSQAATLAIMRCVYVKIFIWNFLPIILSMKAAKPTRKPFNYE